VGVMTSGGLGPGFGSLEFGVFPVPLSVTFRPVVGCSPSGATVVARRQGADARRGYDRQARTVRIRPGMVVRQRLGCPSGRRLLYSGSALAFFTERPPSRRTVNRIEHRHRRDRSVSRTYVAVPRGVGDDERVELEVTALCAAGT
jgi:hypothetical protein